MLFAAGRAPSFPRLRLAAGLLLLSALSGCPGQNAQQAIDKQVQDNPQFKKTAVAKFAGRVTIDGQPPAKEYSLFVILNDPQHLDEAAHSTKPKYCQSCNSNGAFAFSTYGHEDGVPVGKYVVTFVGLHGPPLPVAGKMRGPKVRSGGMSHYGPPDELKNLYNDPDKNAKDEKFVLNLEAPGKDDYEFDLPVAAKEAVAAGPNAWTNLGGKR